MSKVITDDIKLGPHQFWITGLAKFHNKCNTPVYGDDQGNRFCTDKDCWNSYHSISPMEELIR